MNVAVHALERTYRAISPLQANFSRDYLGSIGLPSQIERTLCGVKRHLYSGGVAVHVLPEGVDVPGAGAVSEKPLLTIHILVEQPVYRLLVFNLRDLSKIDNNAGRY
jgi:hypothetical protein